MSDWDWQTTERAQRQLEALDEYTPPPIIEKLGDVVNDEWRAPSDYLDSLGSARSGELPVLCHPL